MTQPARDLRGVLANDLCISCGVCVHADESLTLQLDDRSQMFVPDGPGNEDAAAVCPAVQVDFSVLQEKLFGDPDPGPFGAVHSVMLAQNTDEGRNLRASSGGIIRELLAARLRDPDVDGAIVLQHAGGIEYTPQLLTDPDEVDSLPGSLYHNLPKHGVLDLLRANEGRFVVVGIPCELEGLYQYVFKQAPHLYDRIHSTIGLLCGWQNTRHALRAISAFKDVDYDALSDVSYRGGGPLGELRLTTPDGVTRVNRRRDLDYLVAFDRAFTMPRCHLCINHNNFLADTVVGDAWIDETGASTAGVSIVINRRPESDAFLRGLEQEGRFVLVDVDTDVIERSQNRRVSYGDFAYAYSDLLARRGVPVPQMDGPNRSAARLVDDEEVEAFDREYRVKRELQFRRRYRYLRIRKVTKELGRFVGGSQELRRIGRRIKRRLGLAPAAEPEHVAPPSELPFR